MRDAGSVIFSHEQRRVSLSQLLAHAGKERHGVTLNRPDWGADSARHRPSACA